MIIKFQINLKLRFNQLQSYSSKSSDAKLDQIRDEIDFNSFIKIQNNVMEAIDLKVGDSDITKQNNKPSYWKRYRSFMNAPKVHFVYESISFFLFILLFSYVLLCEFKTNGTSSLLEYFLIVYVITLVIDEMKQVMQI